MLDIKTSDDNNRKLTRTEYNRPDVIVVNQTELEKFFKFNVIKSVTHAPWGAEVMRTTWVITEKTDNLSKTVSKIKARLCTLGNSSTEFSKDTVQFESPTRGRDTVKALLSLVPENKWCIGTFDISSALFQGDSLQRKVYVMNPEGSGFWVLNAVLYGLREGARNWYDRFHRHCISLGFTTAPGDPAAYSYDRDGARGALPIHVDDALTCENDLFYDTVIVPLLSQFSISKLEQSSFKFLGMHVKQTAYFAVSIRQDTKSIKDLPGCRFFEGRRETKCLEVSSRSATLPRLD